MKKEHFLLFMFCLTIFYNCWFALFFLLVEENLNNFVCFFVGKKKSRIFSFQSETTTKKNDNNWWFEVKEKP